MRILRTDINSLLEAQRTATTAIAERPGPASEAGPQESTVPAHEREHVPRKSISARWGRPNPPASPISGFRRQVSRAPSTSSEDDAQDSDYRGGYTAEREVLHEAIPSFTREEGPKHTGLASPRPSNPPYENLMSYRYYCLLNTEGRRTSGATTSVHHYLRLLALPITVEKFSFLV